MTCETSKPVTVIRSFQNADLPILHQLWTEHWSAIGPPPAVREAQLEQAVLARTFFRSDELLVAEVGGNAVGWLQFCRSPDDPDLVVIPTVCLGLASDASMGGELLQEAQRRIAMTGATRIRAGVVRDDQFGYAGLDPIGHGAGISVFDTRVHQVLDSAGYQVALRSVAMNVSVSGFRPPVTRDALQYRRSSRLETGAFCFRDPRHAAGMSHLDVETQCLTDRSGQTLASVNLWLSDPEAEVMSPSLMILEMDEAQSRGRLDAAESFLIAASIQAAAHRKILSVETAIDEDQTELISQLESLQFRPSARGICWDLPL